MSLAQKRCATSPMAVSDSTGHGFPGRKHLTLHFWRVHTDATFREIVDWASEMNRVRGLLQLARTAFPAPSTQYQSFEGVPMSVWRVYLRESAKRCEPRSHGAIDAKFFDRERHRDTTNTARIATYGRSKRRRWSIQTRVMSTIFTAQHTGLTTPRLAVESPFVTSRKSRVSPVKKALTNILSGTPFVQRASAPCCVTVCSLRTITHTTQLDSELYGQRWMAETAFSTIKAQFGPAVHPRAMYREFRELVLTAPVYNLEQDLKQ